MYYLNNMYILHCYMLIVYSVFSPKLINTFLHIENFLNPKNKDKSEAWYFAIHMKRNYTYYSIMKCQFV